MQCESCVQKLMADRIADQYEADYFRQLDITHLADWELSVEVELSEIAIGKFHSWAEKISNKLKGPCPGEEYSSDTRWCVSECGLFIHHSDDCREFNHETENWVSCTEETLQEKYPEHYKSVMED